MNEYIFVGFIATLILISGCIFEEKTSIEEINETKIEQGYLDKTSDLYADSLVLGSETVNFLKQREYNFYSPFYCDKFKGVYEESKGLYEKLKNLNYSLKLEELYKLDLEIFGKDIEGYRLNYLSCLETDVEKSIGLQKEATTKVDSIIPLINKRNSILANLTKKGVQLFGEHSENETHESLPEGEYLVHITSPIFLDKTFNTWEIHPDGKVILKSKKDGELLNLSKEEYTIYKDYKLKVLNVDWNDNIYSVSATIKLEKI